MIRLILIGIVLLLACVGGLAVALNHFFGWKGLIAFPFLVLVLVWLGKLVIAKLIKRFFLGLFSMKSGVLRGATINVHSVTPVGEPAPCLPAETANDADSVDEVTDEDRKDEDGPKEERHYYEVDVTVTPKSQGEAVWEPGEFVLTSEKIKSLEELGDGQKELGTTHSVRVWNGTEFGPDDPGKYPGEQRLKITFAVKPGTLKAWMIYYNEPLGELSFPAWTPQPA